MPLSSALNEKGIFALIKRWFKRRALLSYVYKLGPLLFKRYGGCEQYTVGQIMRTIAEHKLSQKHINYAVALFRHEESFNTVSRCNLDQESLNKLRLELADFLSLSASYTSSDVLAISKPYGWQGGMHTNWVANRHGKTGF